MVLSRLVVVEFRRGVASLRRGRVGRRHIPVGLSRVSPTGSHIQVSPVVRSSGVRNNPGLVALVVRHRTRVARVSGSWLVSRWLR